MTAQRLVVQPCVPLLSVQFPPCLCFSVLTVCGMAVAEKMESFITEQVPKSPVIPWEVNQQGLEESLEMEQGNSKSYISKNQTNII